MTRRWVLIAAAAALVVAGAFVALRVLGPPAYENPVMSHDAPDPSIIYADGFYWAYTTQSEWSEFTNLPILRSKDLVEWSFVGDALPKLPKWVTTDTWAPHISRIGDRYVLYYSAMQYGRAGFGIGVATSDSPEGPFEDSGGPILRGPGFTTIDPFVYTTSEGDHYIYWGSNSVPIKAQQLSDDGLTVVGKPQSVLQPSDDDYENLIEGPWLVEHDDYFYLMYSGDACCHPGPHYAVLVARSTSAFGPFEKYEGNPILESNDDFFAPGHNSTIRDESGRDWILYHSYVGNEDDVFLGEESDTRALMLDLIEWENGWPVINDGHGPSVSSDVAPDVSG
ncbi:MAG: family 43 glycosylhydrolase [Actinobacteria bacterium]|nr:family 43 glycosylhydrolase [Actinomycetota bacterium]